MKNELIIAIIVVWCITTSVVGMLAPGADKSVFSLPGQFIDSFIHGIKTKDSKVIILGTISILSGLLLIVLLIMHGLN